MLRRAAIGTLCRLEGAAAASQGLRDVLLKHAASAVQTEQALLLSTARLQLSAAHLLQQRHYAQQAGPKGAYTPPAALQRGMNMRISAVSSNLLAEPYKGDPPRLPFSAWFTISGLKERWQRILNRVKSIYTLSRCKKYIPGWTLPGFKEEALTLYQKINAELAAGDRTELRHLVTPSVFSDMKRQLKQREDGGWARVEWKITELPSLKECSVVQGRLIAMDPKDDSTGFAQFTVRFPSKQKFAAYDKKGRLVAGSMDKEVAVTDYWVFEHPLRKQASNKWRLAARLAIPQAKKLNAGDQ